MALRPSASDSELRRGDILLFRAWFPDEQNKLLKAMLLEAGARK